MYNGAIATEKLVLHCAVFLLASTLGGCAADWWRPRPLGFYSLNGDLTTHHKQRPSKCFLSRPGYTIAGRYLRKLNGISLFHCQLRCLDAYGNGCKSINYFPHLRICLVFDVAAGTHRHRQLNPHPKGFYYENLCLPANGKPSGGHRRHRPPTRRRLSSGAPLRFSRLPFRLQPISTTSATITTAVTSPTFTTAASTPSPGKMWTFPDNNYYRPIKTTSRPLSDSSSGAVLKYPTGCYVLRMEGAVRTALQSQFEVHHVRSSDDCFRNCDNVNSASNWRSPRRCRNVIYSEWGVKRYCVVDARTVNANGEPIEAEHMDVSVAVPKGVFFENVCVQ